MAARSILCYVFFLLALDFALGLKCPSLIADGEVNMWFGYKFPSERSGDTKFLYRDSDTEFKLEDGNIANKIVKRLVTDIYEAHNQAVNFKGVEDLWYEYVDAEEEDRAEIAAKIKVEAEKLKVYQFWTNDQPEFDSRSPYQPPEDIYGAGKSINPLFELRLQKPPKWSYAHSKMLVSIDMTDGSGFIMDHSYPAVPVNLHSFSDAGVPEPRIFPEPRMRNVFKLGQHSMCVSFPGGKHTNVIIDSLKFMYPRVNTDNFRYFPFWVNNAPLLALIKGEESLATGTACATEWRKKNKADFLRTLGSDHEPFPQCTLNTDITIDGFTYQIISHAAVDKIDADTKPTDPAPNLNGLAVGPYPWKEVMATIKTTMFITARWLVSSRVNSINTDNGFYLVETLEYDDMEPWGTGCEHSKWGVTAPGVAGGWFCAGDTNNENSQITHAGVAICFQDANLRTAMLDMVEKIQWSRYWTIINADPPTQSQDQHAMGGYASTDPEKPGAVKKRKGAPKKAKQKYERHPKAARNKKEQTAAKEKEEEEDQAVRIEELNSDTCDGCGTSCEIELEKDPDEEDEKDAFYKSKYGKGYK